MFTASQRTPKGDVVAVGRTEACSTVDGEGGRRVFHHRLADKVGRSWASAAGGIASILTSYAATYEV